MFSIREKLKTERIFGNPILSLKIKKLKKKLKKKLRNCKKFTTIFKRMPKNYFKKNLKIFFFDIFKVVWRLYKDFQIGLFNREYSELNRMKFIICIEWWIILNKNKLEPNCKMKKKKIFAFYLKWSHPILLAYLRNIKWKCGIMVKFFITIDLFYFFFVVVCFNFCIEIKYILQQPQ